MLMSTITISLPVQIAKKVDAEAKKQGFATRSEFIRNLIRKYFGELTLEEFMPRPLEEIEDGLRKTGKYNERFIKSVMRGFRENSAFYANKAA